MGGVMRPLLLLLVGVTVSTEVDLHKRIIGGGDCRRDERLYHVQLKSDNGTRVAQCGGSLISDEWILTANHCWEPGWNMAAHLGVHPRRTLKYKKIQITARPVVFKDNNERDHDIMLLKFRRLRWRRHQTVQLPDCSNKPPVGGRVQIAGHASTTTGVNLERDPGTTRALQCANTTVVQCWNLPAYLLEYQDQHYFCGQTPPTPGVDLCRGDSGGGVVYNGMIYGVASFTFNHSHACVSPAAFMDVCEYIPWIKRVTGIP